MFIFSLESCILLARGDHSNKTISHKGTRHGTTSMAIITTQIIKNIITTKGMASSTIIIIVCAVFSFKFFAFQFEPFHFMYSLSIS